MMMTITVASDFWLNLGLEILQTPLDDDGENVIVLQSRLDNDDDIIVLELLEEYGTTESI